MENKKLIEDLTEFIDNARELVKAGDKSEACADLNGDFCRALLKRARKALAAE